MTDRINLDDLSSETEEDDSSTDEREGDWFWRSEGPVSAVDAQSEDQQSRSAASGADEAPETVGTPADAVSETAESSQTSDGVDAADGADAADGVDGVDAASPSVPHVPYETRDKPVGIPVEQGGAGGGVEDGTPENAPDEASGPHGGGADDMTMAFTYEAVKRLANVGTAVADAHQWCDWLGIVGDVPAHVLTKFQREHLVDLDFFNGTGTGAAERLAQIDETSMFFAKRMVVVGVDGEEALAERAGWEFVPLSNAAAKAGWDLIE